MGWDGMGSLASGQRREWRSQNFSEDSNPEPVLYRNGTSWIKKVFRDSETKTREAIAVKIERAAIRYTVGRWLSTLLQLIDIT